MEFRKQVKPLSPQGILLFLPALRPYKWKLGELVEKEALNLMEMALMEVEVEVLIQKIL